MEVSLKRSTSSFSDDSPRIRKSSDLAEGRIRIEARRAVVRCECECVVGVTKVHAGVIDTAERDGAAIAQAGDERPLLVLPQIHRV